MTELELWAGAECTVNRVGETYFDQLARTGAFARLEDIDRLADLGVRALRFPVLWERVAPNGLASADFSWVDARLARLRRVNIRPIVGLLHHGSGPRETDLCAPNFVDRFAEFASTVARRYPWVEEYTPINEPLTTARFSALYGYWYPHHRDTASFLRALLNQVEATSAAMRAVRAVNPVARLIQTEDAGFTRATPELSHQARYENHRRWLSYDLMFGRVDDSHPLRGHLEQHGIELERLLALEALPSPPDVVGLNYYLTSDRFLDHRVQHYPRSTWGGNGRDRYADVEAVRVLGEGARSHVQILAEAWQRYGTPLALTEVHLGCSREQQLRWFSRAWRDAEAARRAGVDVTAVTLWSLFGAFDWSSLVTREDGHYEAGAYDVRAEEPRETALLGVASQLARGLVPENQLALSQGWWETPARWLHFPNGGRRPERSRSERDVASVLVIGTGSLSRSVFRICNERGMPVLTHGTRLTSDSLSWLADARPWAVVLAVSRVDARGAAAFLSMLSPLVERLPVLAFSSDRVFDGTSGPYLESDRTTDTEQGRSWCEWEAALARAGPRSLVIRGGPLLDPGAEDDPLSRALTRLELGLPVRFPNEELITPSYAPHLIDAALDLLVDGQQGLWHLASPSACSPLELTRAIAERAAISARTLGPGVASVEGLARGGRGSRALSSLRGMPMPDLHRVIAEYAAGFLARRIGLGQTG
jgi:dTDP-4-dehydrorhamnose reductase